MTLSEILTAAMKKNASDVHLKAGLVPVIRKHGKLRPLQQGLPQLSAQMIEEMAYSILDEKQREVFEQKKEVDVGYGISGLGRFRVNIFRQRGSVRMVIRNIPHTIPNFQDLLLPPVVEKIAELERGLVLVTGITGSGKSSTLAAMINHINDTQNTHILTIEDPIEFVHPNIKSLINQREVGGHTKSFANALKAALREDPDIILVGEMRDLETIQLAMTAAETGHLVFGTLHTNNAHKTIDRIIDVFPQEQQDQVRVMLSESLRGVIAQALLPKAGGGRVAAIEMLVATKAVANLIREGKTFQIPSAMQTGKREGMITYESAIEKLISTGKIEAKVGMEFLGRATETPKETPQTAQAQPPPGGGLGGFASKFKKSG
jgi:twitching motility protein PilT